MAVEYSDALKDFSTDVVEGEAEELEPSGPSLLEADPSATADSEVVQDLDVKRLSSINDHLR